MSQYSKAVFQQMSRTDGRRELSFVGNARNHSSTIARATESGIFTNLTRRSPGHRAHGGVGFMCGGLTKT